MAPTHCERLGAQRAPSSIERLVADGAAAIDDAGADDDALARHER